MKKNSKLRKIVSLQKSSFGQLSGMMIITVITQLLSVYKSSLIGANFGVGVELDAYHFANNLSTFFLTFVSTGVTAVVIPAYIKELDKRALDTFLTVVFSVTGILLALVFMSRGILVNVLTNRSQTFNNYVSNILIFTIWIQLLPAILGVTTAYYQCIDRFTLPKAILLLSNIVIVLTLTIMKQFDLFVYMYVLLAGAVLQFVVDLCFAIHYGFRFRITFDIHNPVYKDLMKVFLPTLFSSGIYKINTMIDSLISSNLGDGQLTILSYANMIVGMVNTLIIGNLVVYAYPRIVSGIRKNLAESQKTLWNFIFLFHAAVCLIIVGFVSVGREFICLLYEHGEFTADATMAVYLCMCIYVFAQQNNIARDLIYRYFFAVGDTKTTVKNGLLTSMVNIISSFILVRYFGVYGIIFGTYIAGLLSLVVIIIRYKHKFEFHIDMKPVFLNLFKTESIVVISILGVFVAKYFLKIQSPVLSFFVFGFLSVILYGCAFFAVHKKNLSQCVKEMTSR